MGTRVIARHGERRVRVIDGRVTRAGAACVELLEARVVLASPSVLTISPADGETNVRRDIFIGADLRLPNGPLQASTVTGDNVKLTTESNGAAISAKVNTSAGGDSIVLQSDQPLSANTKYRFEIDADVKD